MIRRLASNRTVRGFAIIAAASLVIVLLSLEETLVTARALLGIAFFLAIAFFLFLVWRERRGDIETWSERGRRTFYGAIVLAVADIGAAMALGPTRWEALTFFAVLAVCAWAVYRVWREEHRYVS